MVWVCIAVLAFMPASAASAQPVIVESGAGLDDDEASISIGLMDIPASRVKDPRARLYIVDHLKPGTTIHRRVEVRSSSPQRQHIELYAAAASIYKGVFTGSNGRDGNELSSWITTREPSVDLQPGEKTPVTVTIAVPATASEGEQYAVIWAQVTKPPTDGINIGQIHRVGIRVYLDVSPGGEAPTDFRFDSLAGKPVRSLSSWASPSVPDRPPRSAPRSSSRFRPAGGQVSPSPPSGSASVWRSSPCSRWWPGTASAGYVRAGHSPAAGWPASALRQPAPGTRRAPTAFVPGLPVVGAQALWRTACGCSSGAGLASGDEHLAAEHPPQQGQAQVCPHQGAPDAQR